MGYTTEFEGKINIDPPLNAEEIAYLTKFSETRRMDRANGPYFVDGSGWKGQGEDGDVYDYNSSGDQPGLWCQWIPTEDGTALEWDGGEKFYNSEEWMCYIIDHFLAPNATAKFALPFLQANHTCNGTIKATGENRDDRWILIVENNVVTRANGHRRPAKKKLGPNELAIPERALPPPVTKEAPILVGGVHVSIGESNAIREILSLYCTNNSKGSFAKDARNVLKRIQREIDNG